MAGKTKKRSCERDSGIEIPKGKKCSMCSGSAVIFLPYAGKFMCQRHFFRHFEKRFFETVREFGVVRKGETVALGLSGGKDSTTLLYLLTRLGAKLPFNLIAITIDLGIDCDYNRKILDIASESCKSLGVPHHVFALKDDIDCTLDELVAKTGTRNPCSECGVARRYLLNRHARELKADKLAIAHTLNDSAQTVLMNIMRNEPMRLFRYNGHLVQDEKLVPRIKPFLRSPEREVVLYGRLKGLKLLDKKCCPYSSYAFRSFVRDEVERLEKEYPGSMF
ncbi:tRNA 2-thiocytidine biosynthesis protein TtcA, partial [Candidatus Micrarchaeota archaeon]|nr:tRNA 2-thiocytidine biosynthesis protein TtcA [Candidatus Micrarchaeota archaeon]